MNIHHVSECICYDNDHTYRMVYDPDVDEFYCETLFWKWPSVADGTKKRNDGIHQWKWEQYLRFWIFDIFEIRFWFVTRWWSIKYAWWALTGIPSWYGSNWSMDRKGARLLIDFLEDALKKYNPKSGAHDILENGFHIAAKNDGTFWLIGESKKSKSSCRISEGAYEELLRDSNILYRPKTKSRTKRGKNAKN